MKESLSSIPGGMRYYFGREARLRRAVEDAVMSVFDGWGYEEIATPSVDYYALFERGMGNDEADRTFRFTDTDGRMLALRPDVTSSVARAAATLFANAARPLRFCYAATVFRQHPRSHAEWRRQSRQLGCELIGASCADADLEMLVIAAEVLGRLGLRYCITLNHVGVFNYVSDSLRLDAAEREGLRRLIDARDSAGLESFLEKCAADGANVPPLARCFKWLTGKREALGAAQLLATDGAAREAFDALARAWGVVESLGLSDLFEIDFGDVSGLEYYTGLVFKIYAEGAGAHIGGGGRYDELTANFGRREPATGFVLDLDAITEVLMRGGDFELKNGERETASVVEADSIAARFREATRRRSLGERVRME